jgi:type I restriction enzyme S subunit
MNYKNENLNNLISLNPDSLDRTYPYSTFRYVDISSVDSGIIKEIKTISKKDAPSRAKRLIKNGDTILATVRPNLRSFYYFKNNSENIVVSTGFAVLRATNKIDGRFLYYSVTNPVFTEYLTKNAKGAAYPAVDSEIILRGEICLPPLEAQKTIASILSAYDDLIENNTRRIQILEEMARTIYREWFVNFRFPEYENVALVDSEQGLIPEGWRVEKIGNSFETLGGGTPSTKIEDYWIDGTINWFSPSDLTKSNMMFITESEKKISDLGLGKSSAKYFPAYSVMMTSRATIGVTSINTKKSCTNQGFITCIPNELVSTWQIYFWIKDNFDKINNIASGATFKEISKGEFREFDFLIADIKTNRRFVDIIEPIAKLIENLITTNNNLRQQRDLLLPKLISGEIELA